ncbi:site-specific DNA-methyltransferase [Bacillus toyonensis]|uniref:site-specific DNA-methyltransferase n=1 Tax=Bacillus toyonensis TaxID=155322 RepID=UPI00031F32D0|nr:site-specific DNA-methyltransferase [Bacillus toyonensis]PKR92792.1 DNA repair protein [Bacillus cereus Rock4-18]
MKERLKRNEEFNLKDSQLELLIEKFPQCFLRDGSFDIKRFEEEIASVANIVKEGYSLNWLGKSYAKIIANLETETMISPDEAHNKQEENQNAQNVYIKGDNLDVLKHLVTSYSNKIKMIYIDPPYNTGSDEFVYQDNFKFSPQQLAKLADIELEEAERVLEFTDRKSSSHSAWLTFMYPRLFIARQLLTENGVIFISIDENEQSQLKLLCDDVFGNMNFIGEISVLSNPKGRSQDKYIANCHEYLLIYSKNPQPKGAFSIEKTIEEIEKDYPLTDSKGHYREIELRNTHREFGKFNRPNLFYPLYVKNDGTVSVILDEDSIEVYPLWNDGFEGCWTWGLEKSKTQISDLVSKKVADQYKIYRKNYAGEEVLPRKQVKSIWNEKEFHTEKGQQMFNSLFGIKEKIFQSPKSVELIKRAILMAQVENQDTILDFFGGSSTTAQAVMEINAENKSKLKYLLIQLPEETKEGSVAKKEGYQDITQIGIERINRVAKKIKSETNADIDYGFKIFETKPIIESTLDKMEDFQGEMISTDEILHDMGINTILTTWMLQDGHQLTVDCEIIDLGSYEAFKVESTLYLLNKSFSMERNFKQIVELLERDRDFVINKIVVFGYSFDTQTLLSLKDNVKHLINGRKSADVYLEVRY